MSPACKPPPIRDRKTESAKPRYGEGFFSKLLERFARQISQIEDELTTVIEKHFGAGSTEAQQLIERTRIGNVPSGLTEDGLHRQLARNVTKAQDALQDGITLLEERIALLRAEGATTKKEPIFILKPTFWGMSVDLRELWKRWRKR
jgi:hypothetical protein